MENPNGSSTVRNMSQVGKNVISPPMNPFVSVSPSPMPSFSIQSSHHLRCSSGSFAIEDQPSWLDDLLDDSEPVGPKHHQRSASDTSAYFDKTFDLQSNVNPVDPNDVCFNTNPRSFGGTPSKTCNSSLKPVDSTNGLSVTSKGTTCQTSGSSCGPHEDRVEKANQLESSSQDQEISSEKSDTVQLKTGAPKADGKRAKSNRHSAHRSRVRKLQYIADLERNVQALQAENSGFVGEIEFRDQHNLILSMENRTLRQRVDTLSQELLIKNLEHEMLEREIGRLQTLLQLQMHRHQNQQEAIAPQKRVVQRQSN